MTISTTNSRNDYTASSSQTTFAYTFPVTAETDILVYQDTVLKSLTTHYTVSATPTGNVVFGTGLDSGTKVAIVRSLPINQSVDYVENDPFSAETHEDALDRLTIIAQQIDEEVGRSLKLAAPSTTTNLTIPEPSADKYLAWNSAADALENKDIGDISLIAVPIPIASGGTAATTAVAAATALGVGTGDSPEFTAVNVGAATDTTVARVSAGVISVEGDTVATIANTHTWTGPQRGTVTDIGSQATTVTVVLSTSNNHKVTLTGNAAFASPTGLESAAIGQCGSIFITQDGTGSRVPTFHDAFDFIGGTVPTFSTAIAAVDRLDYIVVSATRLQCVATLAYS